MHTWSWSRQQKGEHVTTRRQQALTCPHATASIKLAPGFNGTYHFTHTPRSFRHGQHIQGHIPSRYVETVTIARKKDTMERTKTENCRFALPRELAAFQDPLPPDRHHFPPQAASDQCMHKQCSVRGPALTKHEGGTHQSRHAALVGSLHFP